MLDELEPAITGNDLRVSDLRIRMVEMGEKQFADPVRYAKDYGYTECEYLLHVRGGIIDLGRISTPILGYIYR